jgi:hypothetical protein
MMSLITLLGGGLLRLLPELLAFLNKKTDNKHELEMLEKQFNLETTRNAAQFEQYQYKADVEQTMALWDAQKDALSGQMQLTGNKWIDALNFAVRPVYAYTSLALYYMAKIAIFITAFTQSGGVWEKVQACYTPEDFAFLSGITSFYFVGRVIEKRKK